MSETWCSSRRARVAPCRSQLSLLTATATTESLFPLIGVDMGYVGVRFLHWLCGSLSPTPRKSGARNYDIVAANRKLRIGLWSRAVNENKDLDYGATEPILKARFSEH